VRTVSTRTDGDEVAIRIGDRQVRVSRREAVALREAIGDAVARTDTFVRTTGRHRPDGTYVVARRGADSDGNAKVFESFAAVERLFERLPREFTAEDVGGEGITGSRRHMVVRHVAEHPAFDCEVVRGSPLTVRKRERTRETGPMPEVEGNG
jgi:hypothetical protein